MSEKVNDIAVIQNEKREILLIKSDFPFKICTIPVVIKIINPDNPNGQNILNFSGDKLKTTNKRITINPPKKVKLVNLEFCFWIIIKEKNTAKLKDE